MADDPAGTRLPYARYLDHLRADGTRLAELATDLTAPVPSCPGWTVRDLVEHTAAVYRHKVSAIRDGVQTGTWPPVRDEDVPLVEHFHASLEVLLTALEAVSADAPAWTWWPSEQTAGFWARRMAQESLVHRVDAELAAGEPFHVDEALGADGVDEVLTRFLTDPRISWRLGGDWPVVEVPPCSVLARVDGGPAWLVHLEPDRASASVVSPDGALHAGADAVVSGTGADLDLWLWGRGNLDVLRAEGSAAAIALLSERMVTATQ